MNILVCYNLKAGDNFGFGNTQLIVKKYPLSIKEIALIEKEIAETKGFDNIVVLNVIPLREDEE